MSEKTNVSLPKMRRGPRAFYRDVVREMKHVHWPTRQETFRLTGIVLAICAFTVLLLWGLGTVIGRVLDMLLHGGV